MLDGPVAAMAERVGRVCLAEEVCPPQEEEEVGVEAKDDDEDDSAWHKLEDGGKVEASGEGTVSTSEAKSTETKGDGVDGKGDKPEDGPEPSDSLLYSKSEGGERVDQDHVGDDGDGQVPHVLREDGAEESVAEQGAQRVVFNEVDVGDEASGSDDDDDGGGKITGGKTENQGVTKLATRAIEEVRQNDGHGTEKGETANDHIHNVADMAYTLLLEDGGGVGGVVAVDVADGGVMVTDHPLV